MVGFNTDAGLSRSDDIFTNWVARAATRVHQIRLVLTALVLVLMSVNLNAQSGEGSLTGRVIESGTERALEGAIVTVEGTPLRDYTDETGRFVINGIPSGQYEVTVSYVGLQPASGNVSVSSGQRTTYNPALASLQGVESITVRASRTGADRAINQQRTASGIINVISEEQFGSLVDANIGQALQRLPGLSVDQAQDGSQGSINIRGISGEFNSVQVDGNRVPNSGGSNAFNPRQLAADGVTTIEVIKAPTPDRDGDAVGGIINLVSRSAFQRTGRNMSLDLRTTQNDRSDEWGYGGNFDFSDIFSVGDGENNLGISFSLSSYETDRYSENADQDWVQVDPASNPSLNLGQYDFPVWFMESTHWENDPATRTTNTLSGSIDFRIGETNSFYIRPLISSEEYTSLPQETDINIDTAFGNDIDGDKTYAQLTPRYGRGTLDSEASLGWIGTFEDEENELFALTLGAEHELSNSFLAYDVSFSSNERTVKDDSELNMVMEPDSPPFIFEYEVFHPFGDVSVRDVNGVDPTDLSLLSEGELEKVFGTRDEDVFSGKLDWERYFQFGQSLRYPQ
jgi:TonB-dependent receptor